MTHSALASLPLAWQSWVVDNLARACAAEDMARIMIEQGRFERALAHAAIEDARRSALLRTGIAPAVHAVPVALPAIDTSANAVAAGDRQVGIVAAVAAPRIVVVSNLLSHEECDALEAHAALRMERSPVVASGDGANQVHAHRTSRGAMFQRGESELIDRIERRLAALVQWPVERGEGLQVLRYEKGDEYRPHYDWFDPTQPGPRRHMEHGGQRVATIVIYLSDVEAGGGTSFPNLGLDVHPRKGGAVFFANLDPDGKPDGQTLHAGMPVVRGAKTIATKWLRERTY